ncbi:DUF4142 domain-containing protein [Streptomyces roseolus]|uniref:DUF4142 domain-containing protein n=1 Tax=Streptomyces roseolus TaxID=67358 RepID=UPI001679D2EE|nr:DUF4142 domain-containing protein [Streptomyces roseolus]GGR66401.1 hypothetical protein GCM10010282_69250 [Streptomyces roseolus]
MRIRLISTGALVAATAFLGAPQAFAAEVSDQDRVFLRAAHQGNLAEVAAGEDARQHATSSCVKSVGAALVRDHGKLDADVTALAGKLGVALPDGPAPEDANKLKAVRAKAGTPAYDTAWLAVQEAAHVKTLALIDHELKAGENSEVFAAARAARPVVAMHLDMVRGGSCHAAKAPETVDAGSGGRLAASAHDRDVLAATAVASGLALAAGAGWWTVRARRGSGRS